MAVSQVASKCSVVPSFQPQQVCLRSSKPDRSESLAPSQLGRPKDLRDRLLIGSKVLLLILYHCIWLKSGSSYTFRKSHSVSECSDTKFQKLRMSRRPWLSMFRSHSSFNLSCVMCPSVSKKRCTRGTCTISSSFPRARALWPLDNTLAATTCFLDWWDEFGSLRYGPLYALASWRHAKA